MVLRRKDCVEALKKLANQVWEMAVKVSLTEIKNLKRESDQHLEFIVKWFKETCTGTKAQGL